MNRAIACAVLTFTLSLAGLQANAQCSKSSGGGGYPIGGGGYPGGDPGGGFPIGGGGFPTDSGFPQSGGYPSEPYVAPYLAPQVDVIPNVGTVFPTSTGDYGVYIQHPVNGSYALSKSFGDKSKAQEYVANVENRYWVTYSADGQMQFKEASSSDAARTLASQLRSQGMNVNQIVAVNARIGKPQDEDFGFDLSTIASERPAERPQPEAVADSKTTPADLSFLVGAWQAVARNENGELTKIELKLDDNGWATLIVPGQGGESEIKRRAELKDGQLVLTGEGNDINLGKLASFDANQVILDRLFGQVTFVRP